VGGDRPEAGADESIAQLRKRRNHGRDASGSSGIGGMIMRPHSVSVRPQPGEAGDADSSRRISALVRQIRLHRTFTHAACGRGLVHPADLDPIHRVDQPNAVTALRALTTRRRSMPTERRSDAPRSRRPQTRFSPKSVCPPPRRRGRLASNVLKRRENASHTVDPTGGFEIRADARFVMSAPGGIVVDRRRISATSTFSPVAELQVFLERALASPSAPCRCSQD
jgi:hypothetical protein